MADLTIPMSPATGGSGLHQITLADARKIISQALGKTVYDASFDPVRIANDAQTLLFSLAPWSWRETPLSVSTTAGQQYVTLPDDFGEIVTGPHTSTSVVFADLRPSSLDYLMRMRTSAINGYTPATLYCLTYVPSADASGLPAARMELWPTPTSVYTISGVYRRQPRRLVADADTLDIPASFQQLYRRVLRAHALDEDDQYDGALRAWGRVNDLVPTLLATDGRLDTNLGQMEGAVSRMRGMIQYIPTISPAP